MDWLRTGRSAAVWGVAVACAAAAVYANSVFNGFVWDDTNVLVTNDLLRGDPLVLFRSIDVTRDYELLPYYRPLTQLSFLIEERIHGLDPAWMHLLNLLVHALNSALVYLISRAVSGKEGAALLAGLLFAVHPLNAEAVNFLSGGRNTMLACLFSLSAFVAYRAAAMRRSLFLSMSAGLCLLAGLFSKESAFMTLPFLVWLEFTASQPDRRQWLSGVGRLLPSIVATAVYIVMRWLTLSPLGIQSGIIPGTAEGKLTAMYKIPELWDRLANNLYIMPRYLLSIVRPTEFSLRYDVPSDLTAIYFPLTAAWLIIACAFVWCLGKGRSRLTLFGLGWCILFYLPVSGIVMFPSAPMADRYLYLPAIGLWMVAADQLSRMIRSGNAAGRYVGIVAAIMLVALGAVTVRRNLDWRDDITLFGRYAEQYPADAYSHAGLGNAYYAAREKDIRFLDRAEAEIRKAVEINPRIPGLHTVLGNIRLTRGDNEAALHYYTKALGIFPNDKEALLNRAITHENLGQSAEARNDFVRFLSVPGSELADARPYAESRIRALSR